MINNNPFSDNFYVQVIVDVVVALAYTIYWYCESVYRLFVPPSLKSIDNEIILITGAANGIGRQICLQLANTAASLVCWDTDTEANEKLVKILKNLGIKAYGYTVDVSNRAQVEEYAVKVRNDVGDVNILINNAGMMPCGEFLNQTPAELERSFQVNVFSHFWTLRAFLPRMIQLNHGHIVTVSSAAGIIPTRNLAPYCGTKHAVHGFTEALKEELRFHPLKPKINFTTVYPFSCNTNLVKGIICHSRFPSVLPITEPEFVARKAVDGFRRNYEHIYVPAAIQFFGTTAKALHPKVQAAGADIFEAHVEPIAKKSD